VPATCALLLLAEPLVSTFFQNGQYTVFDTRMTTLSTMALSCGVPAYALVKVLLPAFYSRQDTRTPVRAAVVSLVSNMVFNVLLVALLYALWATPAQRQAGWLQGIAGVPGLHVGLAVASVLSNYLQFAQLWYWLKRAGVYDAQPGWLRHWLRLAFACAAMVAVLLAGRWLWPHWTVVPVHTRLWHLAVLVAAGGAAYVGGLFAAGFRVRDLRVR
jgi:putative peptidoglycan lipid II flippase